MVDTCASSSRFPERRTRVTNGLRRREAATVGGGRPMDGPPGDRPLSRHRRRADAGVQSWPEPGFVAAARKPSGTEHRCEDTWASRPDPARTEPSWFVVSRVLPRRARARAGPLPRPRGGSRTAAHTGRGRPVTIHAPVFDVRAGFRVPMPTRAGAGRPRCRSPGPAPAGRWGPSTAAGPARRGRPPPATRAEPARRENRGAPGAMPPGVPAS